VLRLSAYNKACPGLQSLKRHLFLEAGGLYPMGLMRWSGKGGYRDWQLRCLLMTQSTHRVGQAGPSFVDGEPLSTRRLVCAKQKPSSSSRLH